MSRDWTEMSYEEKLEKLERARREEGFEPSYLSFIQLYDGNVLALVDAILDQTLPKSLLVAAGISVNHSLLAARLLQRVASKV